MLLQKGQQQRWKKRPLSNGWWLRKAVVGKGRPQVPSIAHGLGNISPVWAPLREGPCWCNMQKWLHQHSWDS